VAVTPDGRRAASASGDRGVRLWDLGTGQILRTLKGHTDEVNAVAVTPDGRRAVSASGDGTLRLWDFGTGQTIRTLEGHTAAVYAVAVTPDGRHAVSASGDRTLRLWDFRNRPNTPNAQRPYGLGQRRGGNARRAPGRGGLE
jgi:WD40 repeat protein